MTLQIGSTVFIFDENRRVYIRNQKGGLLSSGGPVYRDHFVQTTITGETPRKWKTAYHREAFKKNPFETGFYTEEQVNQLCWAKEHHPRIRDELLNATYDQLQQIAKILNYKE